ncbi:MAG: Oligopeptide ABC transporter, periplasmic oligopeptide-binding protein OppA [uncultured Rubrobacteraceae bacterium]|uniref:Oligopeptide ABC transporter, periplasmic oligopeptide-binding protein OppA n=1 Tax=uncultured Rubrobacteraceae bacterium TaxID=349277 RepID=A0A6J4PRC3_9ACTN|nr:MAG: Oligopeptide ABC transporter, periplasmic oligopeptide-binding protein OppA [uncultured Rubrobacteraceae bacterium]
MTTGRAGARRPLVGAGFSRRDFLKMGGASLAGATLLGTAGCGSIFGGGQSGSGGGSESRLLNINFGAEVPDLNSVTTTDSVSFNVLTNLMEGLYRLDQDQKPVAAMAEGVETSSDGLTYEFTLRDGIQWSNGDPVVAEDFRYAWLKVLDPETAATYAYIISTFVKGADAYNTKKGDPGDVAIEAPDEKTLRVVLNSKSPFFLQLTSFGTYFPQQQEFVEQQGDNYAQDGESLLYNGPYTMTAGTAGGGQTVVLQKNDNYWDKANVAVETINGRIVKENDTAINLYEGGELDLTALEGNKVQQYEDSPEFFRRVEPFTVYGRLNQKAPGLDNINIRKALMIGFDREGLTDQILQDGSVPAYGYVPPAIAPGPGNQTFREANGDLVPKDVESARALWEKGVEEIGGQAPQLTMLFSDDSSQRDMATYMQDQYKKNLGADLEVEVVTFDAALDRVDAEDYQINYAFGWIGDYDDPMTFLDLYLSDSPFNNSFFENEEYDRLIRGAQTESNTDQRMQMMLEAEKILIEEAGTVPVYFAAVAGVKKPYFKGYTPHSFGGDDYKYASIEGKS